jgi:hypothetical protein
MDLEWTSPVAIGGVGGSGTRLVASMLIEMGFAMGTRLNDSLDDLDFTSAFVDVAMLDAWGQAFDERVDRYLHVAQNRLGKHDPQRAAPADVRWGWKEPNTHVIIERLVSRIPGLRYIHVVRNGLDMAHSSNRHQLRRWGERILGRTVSDTPHDALAYWVAAHRRLGGISAMMGNRFLMLNYDRLCHSPDEPLARLAEFVGGTCDGSLMARLRAQIHPPESIGRFRRHGLHEFDAADVDYVRSLGFDVN